MIQKEKLFVGVDIGGTNFSSTLFNENNKIIKNSRVQLIKQFTNQTSLLDAITEQIVEISNRKNISGIGFACPGPLDTKLGKILDTPNLKLLKNCNFIDKMKTRLNIPCYIENDANLFTLGEYNDYSNHNSKKDLFIGITIGTGLGMGVLINGEIFCGAHGMAAEYGISPINNKSWETNISISGIKKLSNKYYHKKIEPKNLYKMALNNDENALKAWNNFGREVGLFLSHVINMLDPNVISIGGGISKSFKFFQKSMKKILVTHCPSYKYNKIDIFESKNKELSAKLGAMILVNKFQSS